MLTYAVLLCLVGAGLALATASRTWSVEVTARPVPLPEVRVTRTGAALLPWLPALALVGLAGAGALLATRGLPRRLLGVLLALVGLGVTVGGGHGLTGLDRGSASALWPVGCAIGGVLLALGGALTAVRSRDWPTMGARYQRAGTPDPARPPLADPTARAADPSARAADPTARAADPSAPAADRRLDNRRTVEAWDALDRGEDPTAD
ncbi:Trp biosynthesis-associated membrane protein [Micromonospora zhanjiangensis]|uniref:Trp biosynthesis-associated membrane protein n=1 Tax=Micromonospora zhanjiangensis TaxID=1522057 RepID=A0ABV8KR78_9ACTN